ARLAHGRTAEHRLVRGLRRNAGRGATSHRLGGAAAPARQHRQGEGAWRGGRAPQIHRSDAGAARFRANARRRPHHRRSIASAVVEAGPPRIGGDAPLARGRRIRPPRRLVPGPGEPRVTLRTKLVLAQLPLAAGLTLLGFVALRTLDALGRSSQRILQDNYRSVLAAQRMKEAVERVDSAAVFRAAGWPDTPDARA